MRRWRLTACSFALAAAFVCAAPAGAGFHRAQTGDVIENAALPALSGSKVPLLDNAAVNVFTFFKPGQKHSRITLRQIAGCERVFAAKAVRWVAVASDRFKRADIEAEARMAGISSPVLIDEGDALYGRLGVALCPTIGITDSRHRLAADLSFTKVNFSAIISAHIRRQLEEISDAQLQAILDPPAAVQGGDAEVARRRLKYAQKLLQAGKLARALESVEASLVKDPETAAAFFLRGRILRAQGRYEEAQASFGKALKLDPQGPAAHSGNQILTDRPKRP